MIAKILVGTAAGDQSAATVRLAAELAATHGAELVVLRLAPLVDARRVFDPAGVPVPPEAGHDVGDSYPHLRVRTSDATGDALRTVCKVAEDERPDLIVVGHGGNRRGNRLLSRRASNALVERAPCAVLLVAS
jgi:nucleotide-binding universal stress UspA family protein